MIPRLSSPRAPRAPARLALQIAAGLAAVATGFALALLLFFPTAPLKGWLESEAANRYRIELSLKQVTLTFPPALVAEGVSIAAGGTRYLAFDEVRLAPRWTALLSGKGGWSLSGRAGEGRLTAEFSGGALSASASDLAVNLPLAQPAGASLAATLRRAKVSGSWPLQPQGENLCQLEAEGVRLDGASAFGAPSLPLGTVLLSGRGRGGELKFDRLEASAGALLASGDGTLLLATPLGQSRLALNLSLRRGPGLPPLLGDLLAAFAPPAADGTMRLRLGGTLSAPALGK